MAPTPTPVKKGLKLRRALRSAARLPSRVTNISLRQAPSPNEPALVLLRLQILSCSSLVAKDRNGFSDPFVVASLLATRHQTPVARRTLDPTYAPASATWDFPIWASVASQVGALELVVWDKDMLGKEYLGEAALPLDEWFADERSIAWNDGRNVPFSVPLVSTRANTAVSGSVTVKLGFIAPPASQAPVVFEEILSELIKRSRPSIVSAPPTQGVGTVRSHQSTELAFQDDGGLSSDDDDDDDEDDDEVEHRHGLLDLYTPPEPSPSPSPSPVTPAVTLHPSSPTLTPARKPKIKKLFPLPIPLPRRVSGLGSSSSSSSTTPAATPPSTVSLSTPAAHIPPSSPLYDPATGALVPGTPAPTVDSPGLTPTVAPTSSTPTTPTGGDQQKKRGFRKSWGPRSGLEEGSGSGSGSDVKDTEPPREGRQKKKVQYSLDAGNDIVGIVMLEIQSAEDLPRLKNMTRTGWDMDPFVVLSFGKKVFRTRVIRHSRAPVWDEKLLFHVRRYETSFRVQLTLLDWDKLSSNDHIGDAGFDVAELLGRAPQKDAVTGIYPLEATEEDGEMVQLKLPVTLGTGSAGGWEGKHNPVINIRAKYQPYDALRQRFWRQYLKQYDTDDTGSISHLELTSMLDSLNSTLTRKTVRSFFTRHGKDSRAGELSVEEVIRCLEDELGRPRSEKRTVDEEGMDTSVSATPLMLGSMSGGVDLNKLDFSGPAFTGAGATEGPPSAYLTEPSQMPLKDVAGAERGRLGASYSSSYDESDEDEDEAVVSGGAETPGANEQGLSPGAAGKKGRKYRFRRKGKGKGDSKTGSSKEASSGSGGGSSSSPEDSLERVINVRNCPLCHRPRMSSKAEVDIITHMAVCASQDWEKIDKIVVGNFVTASQAQRKWYTKIIGKVSSGDYRLGANSANIIVQNRMTGQLEEEKMQVYVRLGIRLLYKGATSRMEGGRARRLLKSLSIKQGVKYDAPESALDIPGFIEFHGLKVDEILDPLDSFKTFNQFFYRKLKPSARPIEKLDDPYRLVSAADCRLMTFATVDEATRLWIKGREFTVARLLGDAYRHQAEKYVGGALAIFRLAPQDYHRFHSPVEGTIGAMTYIAGEYYTVNPQAIRTSLDVYGENVRKIVPIDSPQFGRVMAVCVGAMMVGSIQTTVKEGEYVRRGQEFGYFAFGGSTIVILFEKGAVEWDEDLLINGRASLETLVRVGMGIGTGRKAHMQPEQKT